MSQAIWDFIRGMGQAIDLGATMAPKKEPSNTASQGKALGFYWQSVGRNLEGAMRVSSKQDAQRQPTNCD